jgi:23S rRNA pseudouridine1911/1915/1917 synthase
MASQRFVVEARELPVRLDQLIARRTGIGRAAAMRLISDGQVRIDGRKGHKGALLAAGQQVVLQAEAEDDVRTPPRPQPELPLSVLYEDADVVVVGKAAGQACHPLRAGELGTVASAVAARFPECARAGEAAREGGVCHRLDTFTSGALLFARSAAAWRVMRDAFAAGAVDKEYLALCAGEPKEARFEVALPLLPGPGQQGRRKVLVASTPEQIYRADALDAVTELEVVAARGGRALLRARTVTGRRHQIRAHLSHLGLPLCGDTLYGGPELSVSERALLGDEPDGYFLHASRLCFPSPSAPERRVAVEAPLPPGRAALLAACFPEAAALLAQAPEKP